MRFWIRSHERLRTLIIPSTSIVSLLLVFQQGDDCYLFLSPGAVIPFGSSAPDRRHNTREKSMKNIKSKTNDLLRPEYKRSDFGEFVRGPVTQVEFAERVSLLLSCLGEDEGIRFEHHSAGNYLTQRRIGEWTYEIDNANQITLRYWLGSRETLYEHLANPPCVITVEDNIKLQNALIDGVKALKAKVADRN